MLSNSGGKKAHGEFDKFASELDHEDAIQGEKEATQEFIGTMMALEEFQSRMGLLRRPVWEYMSLPMNPNGPGRLREELNRFGKDGWQVIYVYVDTNKNKTQTFLLMREVLPELTDADEQK